MNKEQAYTIGTPGKKWGVSEKAAWFERQSIKRLYTEEVLSKLEALRGQFDFECYGALSCSPDRYPLYLVKTREPHPEKPDVLITGGVHGYETSGVQGAIRFLETSAQGYAGQFNIFVAPCLSPWGYETINRWNPSAIDPNRSFYTDSPSEEAAALMQFLSSHQIDPTVHIDLHETTETDNLEFRPALAARDGIKHENWHIPDGFYTVGDTEKPAAEFQKAIIKSVEKVTHIAPPDADGNIIGEKLQQWGVINYAARKLGLCMGFTNAGYVTTTEVYPDSPKVDDEDCINAQVAAVSGGLDYVLSAG
jgi:hypothetical protein